MNARTWAVVIGSLAAAAIVGCKAESGAGGSTTTAAKGPPAELVPSCQGQGENLVVTVNNQATSDAPATFTRVEFSPTQGMAWTVPTPKIKKGATAQLTVPMPKDCHGASCNAKVSTDFTKAMSKSGGKNADCHGG